MHLQMSCSQWLPFCLGLIMLIFYVRCLRFHKSRIQWEFALYVNQSDAVQRIDILSATLD